MDAYRTAIREGYPEVEARELTSSIAALDFHAQGWAGPVMIPPGEIPEHVERHRDFFDRHDIDESHPLGVFTPPGGLPDAPETPRTTRRRRVPPRRGRLGRRHLRGRAAGRTATVTYRQAGISVPGHDSSDLATLATTHNGRSGKRSPG